MPFKDSSKNRAYHREYNDKPDRAAYRKEWYARNRERVIAATLTRRRETAESQAAQAAHILESLASGAMGDS